MIEGNSSDCFIHPVLHPRYCECIPNTKDKTYAGMVANGITAERIDKEETYLLNRSPNFSMQNSKEVTESVQSMK